MDETDKMKQETDPGDKIAMHIERSDLWCITRKICRGRTRMTACR